MPKLLLLPIVLVLMLTACQSNSGKVPMEKEPAQELKIKWKSKSQPQKLSEQQRQQLRQNFEIFYNGTPKSWARARSEILALGPMGEEALALFMIKFFAAGRQAIPVQARSQDLGKYWQSAARELVRLKEKAVPYLIYAMSHPKMGSTGRSQCVYALVKIGRPAIAPLVQNIERGSRAFRRMALQALGDIGDPYAALAIVSLYNKLSLPTAPVTDLAEDSSFDLRYYSVKALGQLRAGKGLAVLEKALSDPNQLVVKQAIIAVLNFETPQAIPALRKALAVCRQSFPGYRLRIEAHIARIEKLP